MKVDELIARLESDATDAAFYYNALGMRDDMLKAAETIKLLWKIVKDNSKYKMQIDKWRGGVWYQEGQR